MGKPPSGIKQLGAFELWRSLPRPCKLFLVVCIVQAFISGTFAARELVRVRFEPLIFHHITVDNRH